MIEDARHCAPHEQLRAEREAARRKKVDRARGSSAQRGYGGRWRKARETFLSTHPLCEMECREKGLLTPATVVDHIQPHRGDAKLFWNRRNWQAGCKPCHDRKTAREDGGWGN